MSKVSPAKPKVAKKRRLRKREREGRRRRLGLDGEGSRRSEEYQQKMKDRTQNVEEFLKATNSKPGKYLKKYLDIGNSGEKVESPKETLITEIAVHEKPLEGSDSDDQQEAVDDFWKTFGEDVEYSETGEFETPKYSETAEIFSNPKMPIESPEKSQVDDVPEKLIGKPEDMETSPEVQIPIGVQSDFDAPEMNGSQENSEILDDNVTESNAEAEGKGETGGGGSEEIVEHKNPSKDVNSVDASNDSWMELKTTGNEQFDGGFETPIFEDSSSMFLNQPILVDDVEKNGVDVPEIIIGISEDDEGSQEVQNPDDIDGEPPMEQPVHVDSLNNGNAALTPEDPTAPESKSEEVQKQIELKTGGGIDEYVKYMQELKKNPPPPKIAKVQKPQKTTSKSASEKPKNDETGGAVIRYKFDEADLVRKPMNLKGRKADSAYKNVKKSKCLIFKIGNPDDETSMTADVRNLGRLFGNLNYYVEISKNLTAQGIEEKLKEFGASAHHGDSAVVAFIAHGRLHGIDESDGKVFDHQKIYSLLGPQNAPRLAGKPKIVLMEQCRGSGRDSGYAVVERGFLERSGRAMMSGDGVEKAGDGSGRNMEKCDEMSQTIPMTSDFLLCFSTSSGHVAIAEEKFGSYHVQALCKTIAERAHRDDLDTMLLEVRCKMARMEFKGNGVLKKQMPENRSTLTRKFFFNIPRKSNK
ncbi:hypothetical protein B9Z55_016094 [Caenorhabditis nigoni]|uniref:Caspase family p20 domain-containing protein n=1 Tax=Caenorhabditis nigoni TaxID=1611254 RepID=A0A2G5UD45_9PELO|nr:hypothetical protein B9Z55_016094 [Caenorhabditis nigoni]